MSAASDDYFQAAERINEWIADYLANSDRYPVLARVKPGDIRNQLPSHPPALAESFEAVFEDFQKIIVPGITHWNHPSFFAYFAITGSAPGILGETLSAALNINGMLWKTCPAATELEEVVLDWLRQMIGIRDSVFGVIMDTASIGTMCAIAAARETLQLQIREKGMAGRPDLPPLRVYTSEHAHSSVEKGAIALGFGQEGVRQIRTDAAFRMIPDALEKSIQGDLERGIKPVCVVATVGTTSTASIDPVPEIVRICSRYNVWLHVDAAYAGSAAVLPEKQYIMNGVELADSFLLNPHKWLFVPFDCTAFYTRRPDALRAAFSLVPEYLTVREEGIQNFMDYGLQLGRRFRALKLWMVIRMFGVEGLQAALRKHIRLAQDFASWIQESADFVLAAPVHLSLVCFRAILPDADDNALDDLNLHLMHSVNDTGRSYLSHTRINGRIVLRLAIGNLKTEREHIEQAFQLLTQHLQLLKAKHS